MSDHEILCISTPSGNTHIWVLDGQYLLETSPLDSTSDDAAAKNIADSLSSILGAPIKSVTVSEAEMFQAIAQISDDPKALTAEEIEANMLESEVIIRAGLISSDSLFLRKQILLKGLMKKGLNSSDLDEVVQDASSDMASNINNSGVRAQLEFLVGRGWPEEEILKDVSDGID